LQGNADVFGLQIPARLLGNGIALLGALGGVLTLIASNSYRGDLVMSIFTLIFMATGVPALLLAAICLDDPKPTFSLSSRDGVLFLSCEDSQERQE
jgi:drug/metabolite transporter (DMT)-like permease